MIPGLDPPTDCEIIPASRIAELRNARRDRKLERIIDEMVGPLPPSPPTRPAA